VGIKGEILVRDCVRLQIKKGLVSGRGRRSLSYKSTRRGGSEKKEKERRTREEPK